MNQMSMGSNIELAATSVRASLQWTGGTGVPDIDASAILLGDNGEVASDADFVFYNQPQHFSGSVRMAGKTAPPQASDQIDVDLRRVPDTVTRIVLAASADGGTFGQVPDLQLVLTDLGSTQHLASFAMQAGLETAYVSAEIYRRNDGWRFRAVGQGYSVGLAGLAADFGIDTGHPGAGDEPTTAPPPLPLPDLPAAPPPLPLPDLPAAPPPLPLPDLPAAPPPLPDPPAAPSPSPSTPQPAWGALDLGAPETPTGHQLVAPGQGPSTVDQPSTPPMPPMPPMHSPVTESAPPHQAINLRKNETTPLVHSGTKVLSRVVFSLGWAPAEGRSDIDLDASVIAFDETGKKLAIVWYMHLSEFFGALQHTGDNRKGGYGDVEQILVDLIRMPANVHSLVFTINSFRGHTFTDVSYAYCAVQDVDDGEMLARFDLSDTQPSTALLIAELRRDGHGGWSIRAIGEFHDYRTVKKLVPAAARHVKLFR